MGLILRTIARIRAIGWCMDTSLIPAPTNPPTLPVRPTTPDDLLASYLSGLAPATLRAYEGDLRAFAEWLGEPSTVRAAERLLAGSHGDANLLAHDWRASMIETGLAPATVNRRLTGLRGLVRLAHRIGLIGWDLSVQGVKSAAYRDTAGPGRQAVVDMLGFLARTDTPKSARDRAIIRLLFERALRRGEVVGLDLDDVDLSGRRIQVVAKGEREARWMSISATTANALAEWIEHRGDASGPLFLNLDRAGNGGRLSGSGVARMIAKTGQAVGIRHVRPHGLRHAAITDALDRSGGDVRKVRAFSRHALVETVMVYDDAVRDWGGEMADLIALPDC